MQISFIGAGNMAGAIIRSIVSSGRVKACDISIYDINTEKCESFSKLGVNVVDSISSVVCASPIVFLAVKPQNYDEVLKDFGPCDILVNGAGGNNPKATTDKEYFEKQNQMFKEKNIAVYAFISGDEELRGPLYEGLVTLEKHRYLNPYLQYLDIKDSIDHVIIADPKISMKQFDFIQTLIKQNIICLEATLNNEYHHLYNQLFTNRIDSPNTLIRIMESRQYATQGKIIQKTTYIQLHILMT